MSGWKMALAAVAILVAGCGGGVPASPAPPSPAPTSLPPVHVAVMATAEDPSDLEERADELRRAVGPEVVVSPEGCFGGLREEGEIPPGSYVLGILAPTRARLEELVEDAAQEPLAVAAVTDLCPV